jgi:hypothetical protein
MASYSGPCEIVTGDQRSASGTATLTAENGSWYGRLSSDTVDWYTVQQRSQPITVRFPNEATATVTIASYTYLQPRHARVVGTGPVPWVTAQEDLTKALPMPLDPLFVDEPSA